MALQERPPNPVCSPTGALFPSVPVTFPELMEHEEPKGLSGIRLLWPSIRILLTQPKRPEEIDFFDFLSKRDEFIPHDNLSWIWEVRPTTTSNAGSDRHSDPDRESLKQEVYALLKHAGAENWDGEGALALAPGTVDIAQQLIDGFPGYIARPDVAATPHGEVDFDWVIAQDVMVTVSVGPSGEIAFSGMFRGARLNGSESWTGKLPQFVRCCFERLRSSQAE